MRQPLDRQLALLAEKPGSRSEPLSGAYFVVSPVGTVEKADVSPPATFLAGDGMVFKLELSPRAIRITNGLVTDPTSMCHEVLASDEEGTYGEVPPYVAYGVAIVSLGLDPHEAVEGLGSRVLANTALTPWEIDGHPMLLVTTDGARPIVFDPQTMQSVGALGSVHDWSASLLHDTKFPFVSTTAHPAYDGRSKDLFTINFGRDLMEEIHRTLFPMTRGELRERRRSGDLPLPRDYTPECVLALIGEAAPGLLGTTPDRDSDDVFGSPLTDVDYYVVSRSALVTALRLDATGASDDEVFVLSLPGDLARALRRPMARWGGQTIGDRLIALGKSFYGAMTAGFTDLLWWDQLARKPAKFRVMCAGERVLIEDSVHQMAVTESYVIFADTQFKFALTLVLSNLLEEVPRRVARILRRCLTRPQRERARLYFVKRADLARGGAEVQATRVELPSEVVHFFADFDDGGGREVVLTVAHQRAMDGAEFVASSDRDADDRDVCSSIVGMFPMSLDLNEVARYVLDPDEVGSGAPIVPVASLVDAKHTWVLGTTAGPYLGVWDGTTPTPPARLEWTAWYNEGFLPELITRHTYRLYRRYKNRSALSEGGAYVSLAELRASICGGGAPASMFVASSDGQGLALGPSITMPPGAQILSPQWVPGPADHPGFIVAVVFRTLPVANASEREREVWVFRADDIREPILRFDADCAGWQYTLHTAWVANRATDGLARPDLSRVSFRNDRTMHARPNPPATAIERLLDRVYGAIPAPQPPSAPRPKAAAAKKAGAPKKKPRGHRP